MKSIDLSTEWMQSIGWTLLHSLWQAAVVFLLLFIFLKATSSRQSKLRYGASAIALAVLFASSVITLFVVRPVATSAAEVTTVVFNQATPAIESVTSPFTSFFSQLTIWADHNMIWFTRLWAVGTLIFLSRLAAGFYFIERIRKNAIPVSDVWAQRVQELACQLNIQRSIKFAEAHIDSPVVIGFAKPVVLFPLGLLSGLSTAQVEAILVHELSHIQRHDFLVNIFQSVMEAFFFFNPLVWMISAYLREEREHCCDDRVIANGISPLLYAQTLAQLEETRQMMPLAMGLSADKNLLLQRIKRIMEKSFTKNTERGRVLPMLLLVLGLVCMSWLTIQRGVPEEESASNDDQEMIASDTTVKEKSKNKAVKVESKKVTTWDKNGVPHEETVEVYEGDADDEDFNWDTPFDMPAVAEFPEFPEDAEFPVDPMAAVDPMIWSFNSDSLPKEYNYRMKFNAEEFAAFEEEFKNLFKEQYKDFWEKNGAQLEKLMEDAKGKSYSYDLRFNEDMAKEMAQMEKQWALASPPMFEKQRMAADMSRFEADLKKQEAEMKKFEAEMAMMGSKMRFAEEDFKELEKNTQAFETEFKEQLLKDGYLKKDEKLRDIRFTDDDITVNGTKIKENDKAKYQAIRKKFLKKVDRYHRTE